MKSTSFFLFVLFVLILPPAAQAAGPAVATHELTVTLDPARHRLTGASVLTLNTGGRAAVRLTPRAAIESVTFDGAPLPHTFSGGQLEFSVPQPTHAGTRRVEVRYACLFDDPLPERFLNSEEPSYGISGIIAPQGTFLGTDADWYPRPVAPVERFTITVVAPAGTEAITAGKRLGRRTVGESSISVWEIRQPLGSVPLAAGRYRVRERSADGIPVYTYFTAENDPLAERYLGATVKYLRAYRKLFGPYPFPKFAVVENFFPTGYGFPSFTLIGGSILRLPFIVDTSLPHEIAHSWWGNGVLVDDARGNWSEGLVTYLADYAAEARTSARAAASYRFRILSDYASVVPPDKDFPLRDFSRRSDAASHSIGYGKAAMLFHMVRTEIGDKAFYEALRRVVADKLFKPASWDDFARAFSAASGKDMVSFMAPWLDRKGAPQLSLAGVTRKEEGRTWLVSGVVTERHPFSPLTVTIRAETGKGPRDVQVEVKGERTPFSFTVAAPPKRLVLDPGSDVFRLLEAREIPPSVNRIKGSESLRLIVTAGCRADAQTLHGLLTSLGQGQAGVFREEEVTPAQLAGHDLLYCGLPAASAALPPLPEGTALSAREFTVDGERFSKSADALFMVLSATRGGGERAIALFLPLSTEGGALSMPKITHYGKFGFLVFEAGRNKAKGIFPPARGSGVVTF